VHNTYGNYTSGDIYVATMTIGAHILIEMYAFPELIYFPGNGSENMKYPYSHPVRMQP